MRIFLDANILFSGANEGCGIQRLLEQLKARHELVTSDYALEEARRNIALKRPAWAKGFRTVAEGVRVVPSIDMAVELGVPQKDRPIMATALESGCDILVTGDRRHFGHLFGKSVRNLLVVSPLMLAQKFIGNDGGTA